MDLYKLTNDKLSELNSIEFSLEKDIQNLVENNLFETFGYELVRSEFPIKKFRIDSLCYDPENNSFVIIEYKKGTNYSVIDQGFNYLSLVNENKAECVMEYNERKGANLKRSDIDWDLLKVVFVSPYFNDTQKGSVNFKDLNFFELWEIKQFEGDFFSLDKVKSDARNPVSKVKGFARNNVVDKATRATKIYHEEDWVKGASEKNKKLWFLLKEKLKEHSATAFETTKAYTRLLKEDKGVCYFRFRKDGVVIIIHRGIVHEDGRESKNYFTIDDPKNLCDEKVVNWSSGKKRFSYRFYLNTEAEVDYAEFLIKQKY